MTRMHKALEDINHSLAKLTFFDVLLNATILFLILYLIFSLFNLFAVAAIIPAFAYLVIVFFRRLTKDNVRLLERRFPFLKEKLRTSADTQFLTNTVTEELHDEVIYDLKRVPESAFFDEGKTYIKVGMIVFLCFLLVVLAPFTFDAPDTSFIKSVFEPDEKKEIKLLTGGGSGGKELDDPNIALRSGNEDIFGERSVALLGNDELTLELRPQGHEISVREVRDPPDLQFQETYPTDITAASSQLFQESVAQEHQELVKEYFTKRAEG